MSEYRQYYVDDDFVCFNVVNRETGRTAFSLAHQREAERAANLLSQYADRVQKLEAVLKPFVDAYNEIPDGERSVLYMWDGSLDKTQGVKQLSISTDTLEATQKLLENEQRKGQS